MGGVAFAVVRLARALPAIRLARQFADIGRRARRAQEGRQIAGQAAHGGHAHQAVTGAAPGVHLGGGGGQGQDCDGGEDETLHGTVPTAANDPFRLGRARAVVQ